MKKVALLLLVVMVLVVGVGCYGQRQYTRWVDDWGNDWQTNNAWVAQPIGWFAIPIMSIGTMLVDGAIDTYYFWADHAWTNRGTPYVHKVVPPASTAPAAAK